MVYSIQQPLECDQPTRPENLAINSQDNINKRMNSDGDGDDDEEISFDQPTASNHISGKRTLKMGPTIAPLMYGGPTDLDTMH